MSWFGCDMMGLDGTHCALSQGWKRGRVTEGSTVKTAEEAPTLTFWCSWQFSKESRLCSPRTSSRVQCQLAAGQTRDPVLWGSYLVISHWKAALRWLSAPADRKTQHALTEPPLAYRRPAKKQQVKDEHNVGIWLDPTVGTCRGESVSRDFWEGRTVLTAAVLTARPVSFPDVVRVSLQTPSF